MMKEKATPYLKKGMFGMSTMLSETLAKKFNAPQTLQLLNTIWISTLLSHDNPTPLKVPRTSPPPTFRYHCLPSSTGGPMLYVMPLVQDSKPTFSSVEDLVPFRFHPMCSRYPSRFHLVPPTAQPCIDLSFPQCLKQSTSQYHPCPF